MIQRFVNAFIDEEIALLCQLAAIPAPSHHEAQRAAFILQWLQKEGYSQSYIDAAGNVICDLCPDRKDDSVRLYMAHMDVVFPDTGPLPVTVSDGRIKAPGIGDNTANVCAMLMMLRYLKQTTASLSVLKGHPVFVFDVCEEGLGNLKGARAATDAYGGRIEDVTAFDLGFDRIYAGAVGSGRYDVSIRTRGGHSFNDFGNANAIHEAAKLIASLYLLDVSGLPGINTYNVGTVQGGTSVNTIAQEAHFTYEMRSDSAESLACMTESFQAALKLAGKPARNVEISAELIGPRPAMGEVDQKKMDLLVHQVTEIIKEETDLIPEIYTGSTDCNIPLSMGIPAICFGTYLGGGEHTREEYLFTDSLKTGLTIALKYITERHLENRDDLTNS